MERRETGERLGMIFWFLNREKWKLNPIDFNGAIGAGMIGAAIDCAVLIPIVLLILFFS